jgi:small subunit ribosomal protein S6
MNFYEHTIIAKQDISTPELEKIEKKYKDIIANTEGEIIKVEKWGLLSFAKKLNLTIKGFIFTINLKLKTKL